MDGNSAKKAPILDHLVGTLSAKTNTASNSESQKKRPKLPLWAAVNNNSKTENTSKKDLNASINTQPAASPQNLPQNRHTDKSQFEIELTKTVNKIMYKHFENASEEIVQQVLSEVRARLPGQRKP